MSSLERALRAGLGQRVNIAFAWMMTLRDIASAQPVARP
jgi:hypothetical protein